MKSFTYPDSKSQFNAWGCVGAKGKFETSKKSTKICPLRIPMKKEFLFHPFK